MGESESSPWRQSGTQNPEGRTPAPHPRALAAWCTAPPSGTPGSGQAASPTKSASGGDPSPPRQRSGRAQSSSALRGFRRSAEKDGAGSLSTPGARRRGFRRWGPGVRRAEPWRVYAVTTVARLTLGPEMTASKRAAKELEDLQKDLPWFLGNLCSEDTNVLVWHALLLPELPPYNLKAFNLRIGFPKEYPLRPPTVTFTTPIYHPNVDLEGRVCLPIISNQHWKPYTKAYQVLEALNMLVNRPDLKEPVRLELAHQLTQTPELFHRSAEEHTLKFGEHRPS